MEAGEWINGGKALFNYCGADGTFIFSALTHTQHISNKKTSASHNYITSVNKEANIYIYCIYTYTHTAFPNLGWEHLPASSVLFHNI